MCFNESVKHWVIYMTMLLLMYHVTCKDPLNITSISFTFVWVEWEHNMFHSYHPKVLVTHLLKAGESDFILWIHLHEYWAWLRFHVDAISHFINYNMTCVAYFLLVLYHPKLFFSLSFILLFDSWLCSKFKLVENNENDAWHLPIFCSAEALDNHLTAVQQDRELKSQIEERKIRNDAAYEEAKRKVALQEEKQQQERAKADAEVPYLCLLVSSLFGKKLYTHGLKFHLRL